MPGGVEVGRPSRQDRQQVQGVSIQVGRRALVLILGIQRPVVRAGPSTGTGHRGQYTGGEACIDIIF